MSKDFTPAMIYLADAAMPEKFKLRSLNIHDSVSEDEAIMRKTFPELTFLYDDFKNIYNKYKNSLAAQNIFRRIENHIVSCENLLDKIPNYDPKQLILTNKSDITDITYNWFFGFLDPQYYYNNTNNSLFKNHIINIIEEAVRIENMNNFNTAKITVPTPNGNIIAYEIDNDDYKGIRIEYIADDAKGRKTKPMVSLELTPENELEAYIHNEDDEYPAECFTFFDNA